MCTELIQLEKMEKSSTILSESFASTASISEDIPKKNVHATLNFLKTVGVSGTVPDHFETKDFYSYLIRGIIKPTNIQRGRLTCLVSVKPAFINFFGGFHGGAAASVAEAVAIATARTVVAEDTELFLGELSISYLSAAPKNAEVEVEGSVVRSGRNLTVIAQEYNLKKTGKLIYTARATFYHMPVSKL